MGISSRTSVPKLIEIATADKVDMYFQEPLEPQFLVALCGSYFERFIFKSILCEVYIDTSTSILAHEIRVLLEAQLI